MEKSLKANTPQAREERRRKRQEEAAKQRAATQRRRLLTVGGAILAALVVVVALVYLVSRNSASLPGVAVPDEGREHVAEGSAIQYQHVPPASGPHYPSPQPWGVYATAVAEGYWVHDLEHGGVVLLYKCDPSACAQVSDQISALAKTLPSEKFGEVKLVATPYQKMDPPFMLVAWDRQEPLPTLDAAKVQQFYSTFVDHGPEDVP